MRILIAAVAGLVVTNPALANVVERRGPAESKADAKACQYTVTLARAEASLVPVQPSSTSDDPLLIAAVAKSINGCPVLVMAHDPRDIRPMPKVKDGRALFQPIPGR